MPVATAAPRRVEPEMREPDFALHAFAATLASGDLSAAAACFTRTACFLTPDGTAVHGREEISAVLAQLIARRTEIVLEQLVVRRAGEVALGSGRWTIRSDGPERSRFVQDGAPTLVLQRIEGVWKIAVLAPWA